MPRKSAAALAVVPPTLPQRPEPPAELTKEQAKEWRAIVATQPVDFFQAGQFPLLVAYCRAITASRTIARLLEASGPQPWKI